MKRPADFELVGQAGLLAAAVLWLGMVSCGETANGQTEKHTMTRSNMSFVLTSPAFTNGAPIPAKYTADGEDVSPPLSWTAPPAGTKTLALLCGDPDAPAGEWSHWVLYDIPATETNLVEKLPTTDIVLMAGAQGRNDFGQIGYGGPAPPKGKVHHYRFVLYAVDAASGLPPRAAKKHVLKAIEGHVLAKAELIGTYKR
jgi:hypothetical protein